MHVSYYLFNMIQTYKKLITRINKMEHIINFTEEELTELKEELTTELSKMKRKTNKKKMKFVGKTLLKLIFIAGGVTVAIVFPSTVVIAALGGMVAVLDGSKGAFKTIRKVKDGQKKRKTGKEELKGVESELAKKKTVREYIQGQQPTAPPLYPRL